MLIKVAIAFNVIALIAMFIALYYNVQAARALDNIDKDRIKRSNRT